MVFLRQHLKPKYKGWVLCTDIHNKKFINFLDKNIDKDVDLDVILDFSIATSTHNAVWNQLYQNELSGEASKWNKRPIPLPVKTQENPDIYGSFTYIQFELFDSDRLDYSHGGTGIINIPLKGRFNIERRHYSGPSVKYTLREIAAK